MREELLFDGVETPLRGGGKPTRCRMNGGVITLVPFVGRGETTERETEGNSFAGVSGGGSRSSKQSSEGVGMERRSSSDSEMAAW